MRKGLILLVAGLCLTLVGCGDAHEDASPDTTAADPAEPEATGASRPEPTPEERERLEAQATAAIERAEKLLAHVDARIEEGSVRDAGRAPLLISRARIRIERGKYLQATELAEEASGQLEKLLPDGGREVAAKAAPAPQPKAKPKPRPKPAPPEAEPHPPRTAAAPPPAPARIPRLTGKPDAVHATLAAYRQAFESCNIGRLQALWRMSETQIEAYQGICARGQPDLLADPIGSARKGKDVALQCMDYRASVVTEGRRVALKKHGLYTAEMLRRPDGWQISAIYEGCSKDLVADVAPIPPAPAPVAAEPARPEEPEVVARRSEPAAPAASLERYATIELPRAAQAGQEFAVQVALTTSRLTRDVQVVEGEGSRPGLVRLEAPSPSGADGWNVDVVLSAADFDFLSSSNMARVRVPKSGDSNTAFFRVRAPEVLNGPVPVFATFWLDGVFMGRAKAEIRVEPRP